MSFRILGTGSYLPPRIVTNSELSQFLNTSDEWIKQRVGINERRVCTTETTAKLASSAAKAALDMSGVEPNELDMIICATVSADHFAPSLACSVQSQIGATCPAMDINAACSGFIYALDTAAGFFSRGLGKILVIGAERLSAMIDWDDRSTAVIFGDGAGAVVLGEGGCYKASKLFARGNSEILSIPRYAAPTRYAKHEKTEPYIRMNGQETFKFAVNAMCSDLVEVVASAGLSIEEISWFIPHQANARIIDASVKKLGILPQRCLKNIEFVGNTSAASIPILTDELFRSNKLREGDYIAMYSFGAGLTSAACVISYLK